MLAASLPATDAVSQSLIYKLSSEISRKMDHKPNVQVQLLFYLQLEDLTLSQSCSSCRQVWVWGSTGFCRLVEGVPTTTVAVANLSCMYNSITEWAYTCHYLIMYVWMISTAAVSVGTPSTNLQTWPCVNDPVRSPELLGCALLPGIPTHCYLSGDCVGRWGGRMLIGEHLLEEPSSAL